jgi:hypothetical protein
VLIGGGGRRVLSIAAREADIVGFNPTLTAGHIGPEVIATASAAMYRERVSWVREAAGDRLDQLEFQAQTFVVQIVPNRDEVFQQMAPAFGLSPEEAASTPQALVGTIEQIVETLQTRRDEYGFSYWVVHEADIEAFAPVVDRLAGA